MIPDNFRGALLLSVLNMAAVFLVLAFIGGIVRLMHKLMSPARERGTTLEQQRAEAPVCEELPPRVKGQEPSEIPAKAESEAKAEEAVDEVVAAIAVAIAMADGKTAGLRAWSTLKDSRLRRVNAGRLQGKTLGDYRLGVPGRFRNIPVRNTQSSK